MIPKKIHYCWFGGNPLPELAKKCIESWKKYCPDYEIIEWNENNYDVTKCLYMKEAYEAKKWAFVSDYARLDIVYDQGGIYLDIDVELIKKIDDLLIHDAFFAMEQIALINTGLIFGANKRNNNVKLLMDEYDNIHFRISDNVYDMLPCPQRNTHPFFDKGFEKKNEIQIINNAIIYPPEYFCPINNETRECTITSNTYSVHHFGALWISEDEEEIRRIFRQYDENYPRIVAIVFKAKYEYLTIYSKIRLKWIVKFINNRIKKRRIRNKLEKK